MIKVFSANSQKIGLIGEDLAIEYLKEKGFIIIERNINTKFGEIDILASREDRVYFFEVKTSKNHSRVSAGENITKNKLLKFHRSIEFLCLSRGIKIFKIGFILVSLGREKSLQNIDLFFD